MRIFVINFSAMILRDTVLSLQSRGVEVLYWMGYKKDFEEFSNDKKHFPNTIFQNNYDALFNLTPKGINLSKLALAPKTILDLLLPYEYQTLQMMERGNLNNLPIIQMKRLYLELVHYWYGTLKKFHPDAIIFANIPHNAIHFIIYNLAKLLHIKTILMYGLPISTRIMICEDFTWHDKLYKALQSNEDAVKPENLSYDLQVYYNDQLNPNTEQSPYYFKKQLIDKRADKYKSFPTGKSLLKNIINLTFFSTFKSYVKLMFFKKWRIYSIDSRGFISGWRLKLNHNRWNKIKKSFEGEYNKLTTLLDYNTPYIYAPLQNQPEMSTNPVGGIFDDQLLHIEYLAHSIPQGWTIVVKENPLQWKWPLSHLGRYKGYYERLVAIPNVKLVSTETSTFDLISHSRAVSVVSGTAGWEAVLRGKPALVFGPVWYMYASGVLRVSNIDECKYAFKQILDGFKPNKQEILRFLSALDSATVQGYLHKAMQVEGVNITYKETVVRLADSFYQLLVEGNKKL